MHTSVKLSNGRQRILKNLALHNIELVRGQAAFLDPHTVAVSGAQGKRQLKGEVIIISTGSKPHRPPEIAFDDIHTFDSDTFLQMDRIPKSLAVIGGGVIGCEYASIFKALGVDVTLRRRPRTVCFRFSTTRFPTVFATASLLLACISCLASVRSNRKLRCGVRLTMKERQNPRNRCRPVRRGPPRRRRRPCA